MLPAKTILYFILFLLVVSLTYFGLNYFILNSAGPKPIFLKVEGFWDQNTFNTVKKDFQEKNPQITLEYEKANSNTYFQDLKASFGTTSGPDVFWWHSGWGPELINNLAAVPTTVMSTSEIEKTFYPVVKASKINGTYRGLPLEIDGLALLYNKTILAAHNFSVPPTDWNSLVEQYIPSLTTNNNKQIINSAIALGSTDNVVSSPEIIGLFFLQSGVSFTKGSELYLDNNKASDGTNLAVSALDFYFSFSKKSNTWDNTLPSSLDAFASGKTAMIILPAQKIHDLLAEVKTQNLNLDFGVAPVPQLPGRDPINWGSYWSLGVSNSSKQKEAAWKLVNFLTSPAELRKVNQLESAENVFGRAYPRVSMANEQENNQYLAAYLEEAPTAQTWFINSDTNDNGLNDNIVTQFKKSMNEIERSGSTESNLKQLTQNLSPILQKYGLITSVAGQSTN